MDSEQPSFIPQHVTPSAMSDAAKRMAEDLDVAQAAREAGLVGEDNRLRKILGTLPITADGVIVMPGEHVYHPNKKYTLEVTIRGSVDPELRSDGNELPDDYTYTGFADLRAAFSCGASNDEYVNEDIRDCYSTRTAAEAAKGGGDA